MGWWVLYEVLLQQCWKPQKGWIGCPLFAELFRDNQKIISKISPAEMETFANLLKAGDKDPDYLEILGVLYTIAVALVTRKRPRRRLQKRTKPQELLLPWGVQMRWWKSFTACLRRCQTSRRPRVSGVMPHGWRCSKQKLWTKPSVLREN